jgi:pimeloyl-ACP methyl ester carboxylesterase
MRDLVRWLARREDWVRRQLGLERWPSYVHILRGYLEQDYDMRDTIRSIHVPMTVLVGGASSLYAPEEQRTIASLAPHAKLVELPGVGHFVPSEAPLRFVRELWRFLREPERALPSPLPAT